MIETFFLYYITHSLKEIRKCSELLKDFNALSGADKLDNMTGLLNKAEDLEEVGKILKYSGVLKDFAKGALSESRWKDQFGDIIEGTSDAAEGVSELKKILDGLGDGMTTGQKAMEGFKNAGKGLLTVFKKAAPIIRDCFYYLPLKTNFHIIIIVIYTEIGILPSIVF